MKLLIQFCEENMNSKKKYKEYLKNPKKQTIIDELIEQMAIYILVKNKIIILPTVINYYPPKLIQIIIQNL